MKKTMVLISGIALGILLVAPLLHALGVASPAISRYGMVVGTIGWFATSPLWIRREG